MFRLMRFHMYQRRHRVVDPRGSEIVVKFLIIPIVTVSVLVMAGLYVTHSGWSLSGQPPAVMGAMIWCAIFIMGIVIKYMFFTARPPKPRRSIGRHRR